MDQLDKAASSPGPRQKLVKTCDARNFIILYYSREGSSSIVTTLPSRYDVIVPLFEHLDRYACPNVLERDLPNIIDYIYRTGCLPPRIAVDTALSIKKKQKYCPIGFKWRPWGDADAIGPILKRHSVTVFELKRRDLLNVALSIYMTSVVLPNLRDAPFPILRNMPHPQFRMRQLSPEIQRGFTSFVRSTNFTVDPKQFLPIVANYVDKRESIRKHYVQPFSLLRIPVYPIFYEDYESDETVFIDNLSHILRLHRLPVMSNSPATAFRPFQKVNRTDLRDQVINLGEVVHLEEFQHLARRYEELMSNEVDFAN